MNTLKLKPVAIAILVLSPLTFVQAQDSDDIEEIVVRGVRAAELKAREAERAKDTFSSIISQDDAGNFSDQNVAESLQRLPGLSVLKNEGEGRFITLRGLGPTFVSVNMNGSELATAGEDSRAFALDAIPSDMLGSIEVFKTLTPDQDLNSLAGVVNVKTLSAFDRKRDSIKLKVQTNKQNYDDDQSPKISLSGTNLLFEDTFGVGYGLSWEKRNSVTFMNEHHRTNDPRYVTVNDQVGLIPYRYEAKQEDAERTRIAGSLTLEYRPSDDHHLKLNLSRTEFEDLDIAMREYHRWGQASTSEVVYFNSEQNLYGFEGTDLQHQLFIQDTKNITNAVSLNGEHFFSGGWAVDYTLAASDSSLDKPGGRRTQFRVREVPMIGTHGSNYFNSVVVSPEVLSALSGDDTIAGGAYGFGYLPGQRLQSNMEFDNLFIEDSFRDDEITQINVNVKKVFETDVLNYIKFGIAAKERNRTRNKDRWSVVPSTYSTFECPGSIDPDLCAEWTGGSGALLGEFETFTPAHPDIQYDFETLAEAERIIAITAPLAYNSDQTAVNIDSTKDDYSLSESSNSIYAMAEFVPFENATLIAGAKYETTTFESQGNFSVRNDREDDPELGTQGDIVVALPYSKNSYSDILPSVHLRFEPREDLLFRAAIWSSFTRPGFDQSRARGSIGSRVEFCIVDPDGYTTTPSSDCGEPREFQHPTAGTLAFEDVLDGNFYTSPELTFLVGNPNLKAMTAINYDTSLSWYASDDLYFQAAFFYKDITDFIADVRGANLSFDQFPVEVPVSSIESVLPLRGGQVYTDINYSVNGEKAKVYGLEVSFAKNFDNGLFVSGNATLLHSSAKLDPSLRAEEIALPFQANEIGNLTLGWENDDISIRLSSNYRSKTLEQIGACGSDDVGPEACKDWADIYHDNTFSVDFKASWAITHWLDIYFDALNLTDDTSVKYFQGNDFSNGKILYQSEDFGSSYQIGMNVKFM